MKEYDMSRVDVYMLLSRSGFVSLSLERRQVRLLLGMCPSPIIFA